MRDSWRYSLSLQEQPIDYAVPKRKEEDEERGREGAKVSRAIGNSIARPLLAMRLSGPQVVHAAAGHGRTSNSGGSSSSGSSNTSNNSGSSSSSNSGGSGSYCGGGAATGGSGGGGAVGGGAGGGMNPGGNGGRGNYGPSSPPTGSLPPFYESLKGGNNLANFANQYNSTQGTIFNEMFLFWNLEDRRIKTIVRNRNHVINYDQRYILEIFCQHHSGQRFTLNFQNMQKYFVYFRI